MGRTPQHIYASNLLRRQSFGYPLRNPRPKDNSDSEGLRIGDVGYVDKHGKFNLVFNIHSPPKEPQDHTLNFSLSQPVAQRVFGADRVLMAGVKRDLRPQAESEPRVVYAFTTIEREGAILILPDGAILYEFADTELEKIREYATRCALGWCRYADKNSLYLLTAVYKSKSWTLGSFYGASKGSEILVTRPCDSAGISMYKWQYQSNVDDQQGPEGNSYLNQTVLVQGFKMTTRKGWLPVDEWSEWSDWWFARILAKLCLAMSPQWLTRTTIDYFPYSNLSQPHHPLDVVNRVLLDKNPGAHVAVTHDNDWVDMLGMGLSPEYLAQEEQLQDFVVKKRLGEFDSNHQTVRLRNKLGDTGDERDPVRDPSTHSGNNHSRLVVTNMRLENLDISHIYAGVCVVIQFGSTTRRTTSKPHATIVEWDDEIMLPSDGQVSVTVFAVFQLGSTLGTRELSTKQTINSKHLFGGAHLITLSAGETEPHSSLLITLCQHVLYCKTFPSYEKKSNFVDETNSGFDALYSYHDDPKKEHLKHAVEFFQRALEHNGLDSTCHATALFNLATVKFIKCLAFGTYSELSLPIELYEDALKLRESGHPDRPATLLLLAQALLSRLGQKHDQSIVTRVRRLLAEISPDDSRGRQTADAILRTCRFYRVTYSESLKEVDDLFTDLGRGAYVPQYGYFDRPHLLHRLGVAFWARFQLETYPGDLDNSIALNQEALSFIPDEHGDKTSIVACLGRSFLRHLEVHGQLTDVDMSVSLLELGEKVVATLSNVSSVEGTGILLEEEKLRGQIALMSAVDFAIQDIEQAAPSPRTPVIQSLIDEWRKEDSISTGCKRQLGVLLSFLGGQGDIKMRALLAKEDWPFKVYKTDETVQILRGHMPYFQDFLFTELGIQLTADNTFAAVAELPKFQIRCAVCNGLLGKGLIKEAIACFRRMKSELVEDMSFQHEQLHWGFEFQSRCKELLEKLGDVEMESENYAEAAGYFSTMLSLNPTNRVDILIKRSRAQVFTEEYDKALCDADEVIQLAALSYRGYELRYAALHAAGRDPEAFDAFDAMLCKLEEAPDIDVCVPIDMEDQSTVDSLVTNSCRERPKGISYVKVFVMREVSD